MIGWLGVFSFCGEQVLGVQGKMIIMGWATIRVGLLYLSIGMVSRRIISSHETQLEHTSYTPFKTLQSNGDVLYVHEILDGAGLAIKRYLRSEKVSSEMQQNALPPQPHK